MNKIKQMQHRAGIITEYDDPEEYTLEDYLFKIYKDGMHDLDEKTKTITLDTAADHIISVNYHASKEHMASLPL